MIAEVTAVSPARYVQWINQQKAYLAAADAQASTFRAELSGKPGAAAVELTNK